MENGDSKKVVSTDPKEVRGWVHRDLVAAHYFLGMLLRYPEIIDQITHDLIQHVRTRENGSAVDTAVPDPAQVNMFDK